MPNKNYLFLCCLFTSLSSVISAQTYLGIKGNYGLSIARSETIKYDDAQDFLLYNVELTDIDILPGFSAFVYYRNDPFYLQAELGYRRTNLNFLVIDALDFQNLREQRKMKRTDYLRIPVHGGLQFYNIKLGAGAIVSIIANQNEVFKEFDFFEERRKNVETSFTANFGIVFRRLQLEFSYEYQTSGIADYVYFRSIKKGFTQDVHNVNLGISLLF